MKTCKEKIQKEKNKIVNYSIHEIKVEEVLYLFYEPNQRCTTIAYENEMFESFKCSCKNILTYLCIQYGSTLNGRIGFASTALAISKKVPVLISERNEVIFFPLYGYRNEASFWIAFNQVKQIYNEEDLTTKIIFKNNTEISVSISYRSMYMQMRRCKSIIKLLNGL